MIFQNSPASFDRIVFAMIWRIIYQMDIYGVLFCKDSYSFNKLCSNAC